MEFEAARRTQTLPNGWQSNAESGKSLSRGTHAPCLFRTVQNKNGKATAFGGWGVSVGSDVVGWDASRLCRESLPDDMFDNESVYGRGLLQ